MNKPHTVHCFCLRLTTHKQTSLNTSSRQYIRNIFVREVGFKPTNYLLLGIQLNVYASTPPSKRYVTAPLSVSLAFSSLPMQRVTLAFLATCPYYSRAKSPCQTTCRHSVEEDLLRIYYTLHTQEKINTIIHPYLKGFSQLSEQPIGISVTKY